MGAVLAGVVLATVGVFALVGGATWFTAAQSWIWPLTLIGLGVAFLVGRPPRPRTNSTAAPRRSDPAAPSPSPSASAGEHRPGDHIGPEGGQDR
jgi:hypothetical protein